MIFHSRGHLSWSAYTSFHISLCQSASQRTWYGWDPKSTRSCGFCVSIQWGVIWQNCASDEYPRRIRQLGESHSRFRLACTSLRSWSIQWRSCSGADSQSKALKDLIVELQWIWMALSAVAPFVRGLHPAWFGQSGEVAKARSSRRGGTQCWRWCWNWWSFHLKCQTWVLFLWSPGRLLHCLGSQRCCHPRRLWIFLRVDRRCSYPPWI